MRTHDDAKPTQRHCSGLRKPLNKAFLFSLPFRVCFKCQVSVACITQMAKQAVWLGISKANALFRYEGTWQCGFKQQQYLLLLTYGI